MKFLLAAILIAALASCATFSAQPDPSRFYTLSPRFSAGEIGASTGQSRISLGIGPVSVPAYLDRQELVTRIGPNRLRLSERDRWAEPLAENIARVVAQNISAILEAERIANYPWPVNQKPLYQTEIEVLRFETDSAPAAHLAARWTVRHTGKKDLVLYRQTQLSRAASGRAADAAVAALSEALAELSREIAAAIENLESR